MRLPKVEGLERDHEELRTFLENLGYLKEQHLDKKLASGVPIYRGGPVQNVPKPSKDYELGLRLLIPLPWFGDNNLANEIMSGVENWAQQRGLERFGYVFQSQCPLLLIGLRKPATS